jgi:penicillin amidase
LNVIYGDAENNIAWYAAAKLVKRKEGLNPNLILDGSGPEDWLGYYDFKDNPQAENPPRGIVLSANNPVFTDSIPVIPGYYVPKDRLLRLNQLLRSKKTFSLTDIQKMNTDVINPVAAQNSQIMLKDLPATIKLKSQIHQRAAEILDQWNGSHNLSDIAPVIYYKFLFHVLQNTFADELEEKDFEALMKTHAFKSSIHSFLENDSSAWWDNISTSKLRENKAYILEQSFDSTITELIHQFGPDPDAWLWSKVHKLEIEHVLGKQKPLNRIFNIGPFPSPGGIETVNNQSFEMNSKGEYRINLAPAVRRTLDFSRPETGYSIMPSGQSGTFMSRNYDNQTKWYINGNARKELMNKKEIEGFNRNKMSFVPPQ